MSSVGNVGYRRYNIESHQSWPSPTMLKVMTLIGTIAASCLSYAMGNGRGYYEGRTIGYRKGFDEAQAFEQEWCAREFMQKCGVTKDGEKVVYRFQPRN